MANATDADERANTQSLGAALFEGFGNVTRGTNVGRAAEFVAQGLRSEQQNRFQFAQTLLSHLYPQFQAHVRNGPQFVQMMSDALGAMGPGVPANVRREKMRTVRRIMDRVWIERYGTRPPAPGAMMGSTGLQGTGQAPTGEHIDADAPATGEPNAEEWIRRLQPRTP